MVRVAIDKRSSPVEMVCLVAELWALKPSFGPFESKVILGKSVRFWPGRAGRPRRGRSQTTRKTCFIDGIWPNILFPELPPILGLWNTFFRFFQER